MAIKEKQEGSLWFGKEDKKGFQRGNNLLNKWWQKTCYSYSKMNLNSCFTLDTGIHLKQIKIKTTKLLEVIGNLYNHGESKDFLGHKSLKQRRENGYTGLDKKYY